MELIKASFEILDQNPGLKGIYQQAELPGRICYGSMDKITDDSAEPFVKRLMAANHGAPLEHGTVYLDCPEIVWNKYVNNEYSKTSYYKTGETYNVPIKGYIEEVVHYYVSTNLRVVFENGWLDDLKYQCEPTKYHEKRIMVKFTTDIGVSREYNRHRKDSMNEGSTRYCNLTKDKFGGGNINFIRPEWIPEDTKPLGYNDFRYLCNDIYLGQEKDEWTDILYWLFALKTGEYCYNNLIRLGWKPEQARGVLPLATKTPLIHTSFISDWCHFFNLRAIGTTGAPHPQAKELAEPLMNEFINCGLVKIENNICIPA